MDWLKKEHTSAYVNIRQHTSAYVSIHQRTSAYADFAAEKGAGGIGVGIIALSVRKIRHKA